MTESLIKSRARVRDHGEVYTPRHIVDAMLDLIPDDAYALGKTWLEPAMGNGNILVAIIERKIQRHGIGAAVQIARDIYGIELLADNVVEARVRALAVYARAGATEAQLYEIADVIAMNLMQGDFLNGGGRIGIVDHKTGRVWSLDQIMPMPPVAKKKRRRAA